MTIEVFIEKLQEIQKSMPGAIMKYGDIFGPDISPRIVCYTCKEVEELKLACIADSKTELEIMFDEYDRRLKGLGVTEDIFYKDLLKDFSLKDIEKYVPERYEHAKEFCEKNGLA